MSSKANSPKQLQQLRSTLAGDDIVFHEKPAPYSKLKPFKGGSETSIPHFSKLEVEVSQSIQQIQKLEKALKDIVKVLKDHNLVGSSSLSVSDNFEDIQITAKAR